MGDRVRAESGPNDVALEAEIPPTPVGGRSFMVLVGATHSTRLDFCFASAVRLLYICNTLGAKYGGVPKSLQHNIEIGHLLEHRFLVQM